MKTTFTTVAAFASIASAHFTLDYPKVRGFNEGKLVTFPCGSFDTPSSSRTSWPLTGGQVSLTMGHINANVAVNLAIGSNPGSSFNIPLKAPISETGLGSFCITGLSVPAGLNITDGTLATIQVLTNGDPDGGLYNCADIIFSATAAAPTDCKNGTGVTAVAASSNVQPNVTSSGTSSGSGSGTSSSAAAGASETKKSAAGMLNAGIGGLVLAGAAAFAIVL